MTSTLLAALLLSTAPPLPSAGPAAGAPAHARETAAPRGHVAPQVVTEPGSVAPAPDGPSPEPVAPPRVGSVAITIVGAVDSAALSAAIESRLAPLGIASQVETAPRVSPHSTVPPAADRIAEAWIIASGGELRVLVADPSHEHLLVRTVPIEEPIDVPSLERAAQALEAAIAIARAGTWPEPTPTTSVVVERPVSSTPEASEPALEGPPRPRGRFLRGLVVGITSGVSRATDEHRDPHLGIPAFLRVGWVFGRNRELPDLRASIEARMGTLRIVHPAYDSLSVWQLSADTRIGATRGPVWIFGLGGIGTGMIRQRTPEGITKQSVGLLATVGLGVAVRLSNHLGIHVDVLASGDGIGFSRIGADVGLAGYFGRPRKEDR